jgi:hypothetical protein
MNSALHGKPFPHIVCRNLAGDTITLPGAALGKKTLVVMAYRQATQPQVDTWLKPWNARMQGKPGVAGYEIPMIKGFYKPFRGWIDGGMASALPRTVWEQVVTYYGSWDAYLPALGVKDTQLAYVYLLDAQGLIRWTHIGPADEASLAALFLAVEGLGE